MFCSSCGAKVADDAVFCSECGMSVAEETHNPPTRAKKKLPIKWIAVVAGAMAAVILIVCLCVGGGNYEKVAEDYAYSYYIADYKGIRKHLPYDVDEMFCDMVYAVSREEDWTISETCEEMGQGLIYFNDPTDMLEELCEACYDELLYDSDDTYYVETEVVHSRKMTDYEMNMWVSQNNEYYDEWCVDLRDYVDVDKIKKGYVVDVAIVQQCWADEEPYDWIESYAVVKYKGGWKVLTIFDPDLY